jgi:hypothetical protein
MYETFSREANNGLGPLQQSAYDKEMLILNMMIKLPSNGWLSKTTQRVSALPRIHLP